jgi:hypothetical protein
MMTFSSELIARSRPGRVASQMLAFGSWFQVRGLLMYQLANEDLSAAVGLGQMVMLILAITLGSCWELF